MTFDEVLKKFCNGQKMKEICINQYKHTLLRYIKHKGLYDTLNNIFYKKTHNLGMLQPSSDGKYDSFDSCSIIDKMFLVSFIYAITNMSGLYVKDLEEADDNIFVINETNCEEYTYNVFFFVFLNEMFNNQMYKEIKSLNII